MNEPKSQRPILEASRIDPIALDKMSGFHQDTLREIEQAIAVHDVVVVGMAQNPHVKRAREMLKKANVPFHYLEYGSYLSEWRRRLAIKLWTGWATFPQVFVKGVLIGGADLTEAALASGEIARKLKRDASGAV